MTRAGFPHSDILGSRFVCQLPEAYRRLPRPSSAPSAKASTLCPYKLDHKDHSKMLASTVQFSSYDRFRTHSRRRPHTQWSGTTDQVQPAGQARTPPPTGDQIRATAPSEQPSGCSLRTQQRAKPTPRPMNLRSLPAASCRRTRSHRPRSRP